MLRCTDALKHELVFGSVAGALFRHMLSNLDFTMVANLENPEATPKPGGYNNIGLYEVIWGHLGLLQTRS